MKNKPFYIWLSFIALFYLLSKSMAQCSFFKQRKKVSGYEAMDIWIHFCVNAFYCWFLLFMLPTGLFALLNWFIAQRLDISGLDGYLNLPVLYILGVNALCKHVKWRKKHNLDSCSESKKEDK